MATGTGLVDFAEKFPKRFFDVGIAEQHAVTFSGGLARNGMVPVFAVYSTFLQRSYDQLIHDVAMQGLKVIYCIDRAGFVGTDGESHQGVFDTPAYFEELSSMLYQAVYKESKAVAIRYPRGSENAPPEGYKYKKENYSIFGDETASACLVSYGREFSNCYDAYNELEDVFLIKLNKIKPLDVSVCEHLREVKQIFFFEEGIKTGGTGECFAAMLEVYGVKADFKLIAVKDEFIKQAEVSAQLEKYHLDKDSIVQIVNNNTNTHEVNEWQKK